MLKLLKSMIVAGVFASLSYSATVEGVVTDNATGSNLSDVIIRLMNGRTLVGYDTTTADGKFSFANLQQSDNYKITSKLTGYFTETEYFEIESATEAKTVNITMSKEAYVTVSGIVKDSITGNPIEGVGVGVMVSDREAVVTSANGSYSIDSVPAGDQTFKFSKNGYKKKEVTQKIVATGPVTIDILLIAQKLSKVSGVVKDSATGLPIPDAEISFYSREGYYNATTDENGSYVLDSIAVGNYDLSISAYNYMVKEIEDVIIGESPVILNVSLQLSFFVKVSGKITDSAGNALSGAIVTLWDLDNNGDDRYDTTGSDGMYSFEDVAAGERGFDVERSGFESDDTTYVIDSDVPVVINFTLQTMPSAKVTGIVKDSLSGQPISGAIVRLTPGTTNPDVYDTTAADGKYEFANIEIGSLLTFQVSASGYTRIIRAEEEDSVKNTDPMVIDFLMVKTSSGVNVGNVRNIATPCLQLLSSGSLKLSNIQEAGELRVIGLNGKVVYRCHVEKGNAVVQLSQQILLSRSLFIVKLQTGKNSLQQALLPLGK